MRTLVLNAGYEPLAVVSFKRALVLVMNEKAVVVERTDDDPVWGTRRSYDRPAVILLTRYVSLGSLIGSAAMFPAMLLVLMVVPETPLPYVLYSAVGAALIWLAHADNIDRLLHGTERKFDLGLLAGKRPG